MESKKNLFSVTFDRFDAKFQCFSSFLVYTGPLSTAEAACQADKAI